MDRVGFPVLAQQRFWSNVLMVYCGRDSARRGMFAARRALIGHQPEPLTVDDDTYPARPIYFFDAPTGRTVSKARYALMLRFFGIERMDHPAVEQVVAAAHQLVVVTDARADAARRERGRFGALIPEAKRAQLHVVGGDDDLATVLGRVIDDIVAKAPASLTP